MRICGSAWFMKPLPCCIWSRRLSAHLTSGARRPNTVLISLAEGVECPESRFGPSWTGTRPKDSAVYVSLFSLLCPPLMLSHAEYHDTCSWISARNVIILTTAAIILDPLEEEKMWKTNKPLQEEKRSQIWDANSHGTWRSTWRWPLG